MGSTQYAGREGRLSPEIGTKLDVGMTTQAGAMSPKSTICGDRIYGCSATPAALVRGRSADPAYVRSLTSKLNHLYVVVSCF